MKKVNFFISYINSQSTLQNTTHYNFQRDIFYMHQHIHSRNINKYIYAGPLVHIYICIICYQSLDLFLFVSRNTYQCLLSQKFLWVPLHKATVEMSKLLYLFNYEGCLAKRGPQPGQTPCSHSNQSSCRNPTPKCQEQHRTFTSQFTCLAREQNTGLWRSMADSHRPWQLMRPNYEQTRSYQSAYTASNPINRSKLSLWSVGNSSPSPISGILL